MTAREHWTILFLGVVAFVVVANVAFLDYVSFIGTGPLSRPTVMNVVQPPAQQTSASCSQSCLTAIQDATASLKTANPSPTPVASPTPEPKAPAAKSTVPKDYYIPLGTGYTTNNQWEDVSGTDITINASDYGSIKSVVFQASMHIPVANGTMYARLYNVTDNHPVWNSDVSTGAGTSTMVSSSNMSLDTGNKLYRVQISTSLQYPSYLDFARIKITLQ